MLFLFLFKLSKSFPKIFIIKEIGVITIKNTIPITIGEIILPSSKPNLNHNLFNGDKIDDMGISGKSTGTHLHCELRVNGTPVNPITFIRAAKNVF